MDVRTVDCAAEKWVVETLDYSVDDWVPERTFVAEETAKVWMKEQTLKYPRGAVMRLRKE